MFLQITFLARCRYPNEPRVASLVAIRNRPRFFKLQKKWDKEGSCWEARQKKVAEKAAAGRWDRKMWQKRWLQQRSLKRQIRDTEQKGESIVGKKEEEFFWEFWGKRVWVELSRKLRIEERRVVGESPGHGAEKGDFQVWPLVFCVYFSFFFSYCPGLIVSVLFMSACWIVLFWWLLIKY